MTEASTTTTPITTTVDQVSGEILAVNGLPIPSRSTRRNIVIATTILCWLLIAWLVVNGNDKNTLHISALSWGFGFNVSVIFAYVFGAVIDNFNFWKTVRTTS